jgi:hypothetical protein
LLNGELKAFFVFIFVALDAYIEDTQRFAATPAKSCRFVWMFERPRK